MEPPFALYSCSAGYLTLPGVFSVDNRGDNTGRGDVAAWSHHVHPPASLAHQPAGHRHRWHLEFSRPGFQPSPQSLQCLRIGDEEAAEEDIHLDPKQERSLLELWERLIQHQHDADDDDYAEGKDDVEVGEGNEVGDGPPRPSGNCKAGGVVGLEGPGDSF